MKTTKNIILLAYALLIFSNTNAQTTENENVVDKSGTNPAVLNNVFDINNEYRVLKNNNVYFNTLKINFTKPFYKGRMAVKVTTPFISTNAIGTNIGSIGDLLVKYSWVAFRSKKMAGVVAAEFELNTTTEKILRSNKNDLKISYTQAFLIKGGDIIAPAYAHTFSLSNSGNAHNTNIGSFDLYYVKQLIKGKSWLTSDLAYTQDFANGYGFASLKLTYGQMMIDGVSIAPYTSIAAGSHRDYNYSIGTVVKFVF